MKDNISEITKEIMELCELMSINQQQIRYVMISGAEFIGEALSLDYEDMIFGDVVKNEELTKNSTIFFHPMKINIDVSVTEDGHLFHTKYFSVLNPYSHQPCIPLKNYNILNQTPIYPDLMLEYLEAVYSNYFSESGKIEQKLIESSLKKNNVVDFQEYRRKL
jgi:hypothetical protein